MQRPVYERVTKLKLRAQISLYVKRLNVSCFIGRRLVRSGRRGRRLHHQCSVFSGSNDEIKEVILTTNKVKPLHSYVH